jgi:hypothetical protein
MVREKSSSFLQCSSVRLRRSNAVLHAMVGLAVPILDVVDGSGGVCPQPPYRRRERALLDLRGGA